MTGRADHPTGEAPGLPRLLAGHRAARAGAALIAAALLLAAPAAAQTPSHAETEARALELEDRLMAPCCGANTLADHDSPAAHAMKREIRALLAAGESEEAILARYAKQHGDTILSLPPASGFNLVAYLVPMLALILGPLLLWRRLRRAPADPPAGEPPPVPRSDEADPRYRERLERALREG